MLQGSRGGDLSEAIDVIAVTNFVKRGNERRCADEISNALKAQRISFRKGASDQDMLVCEREPQRIFLGEIRIGLVQDNDAFLSAAEFRKLGRAVASPAGRIGRRNKSQ